MASSDVKKKLVKSVVCCVKENIRKSSILLSTVHKNYVEDFKLNILLTVPLGKVLKQLTEFKNVMELKN